MSWFSPAKELSPKAAALLKEMAESGSCEVSGVAEILNTIAENGDEQATDEFLSACAAEIRAAAASVHLQLLPGSAGGLSRRVE